MKNLISSNPVVSVIFAFVVGIGVLVGLSLLGIKIPFIQEKAPKVEEEIVAEPVETGCPNATFEYFWEKMDTSKVDSLGSWILDIGETNIRGEELNGPKKVRIEAYDIKHDGTSIYNKWTDTFNVEFKEGEATIPLPDWQKVLKAYPDKDKIVNQFKNNCVAICTIWIEIVVNSDTLEDRTPIKVKVELNKPEPEDYTIRVKNTQEVVQNTIKPISCPECQNETAYMHAYYCSLTFIDSTSHGKKFFLPFGKERNCFFVINQFFDSRYERCDNQYYGKIYNNTLHMSEREKVESMESDILEIKDGYYYIRWGGNNIRIQYGKKEDTDTVGLYIRGYWGKVKNPITFRITKYDTTTFEVITIEDNKFIYTRKFQNILQ